MSKLPMRDDEIANSYRLAKDPEAQVTVLAELNATTPENIKRILVEREVYVPPMRKVQKTAEKKAKHRWTKEELNRAEDMLRSGYSYRQIAKELGTKENATRVTVGKWMREKEKSGGRKWKPKRSPYRRKQSWKKNQLQNNRILSYTVSRGESRIWRP